MGGQRLLRTWSQVGPKTGDSGIAAKRPRIGNGHLSVLPFLHGVQLSIFALLLILITLSSFMH
jgi:hypothetical protein